MLRGRLAVLGIILVVGAFPFAGSVYVDEYGVSHGPNEPTDLYRDPATSGVFLYNEVLGTLTPKPAEEAIGLFINFYNYGEDITEYGNAWMTPVPIMHCAHRVCMGFTARLVGEYEVDWAYEYRWKVGGSWTEYWDLTTGELEYLLGGTPVVTGGSAYPSEDVAASECEFRATLVASGGVPPVVETHECV